MHTFTPDATRAPEPKDSGSEARPFHRTVSPGSAGSLRAARHRFGTFSIQPIQRNGKKDKATQTGPTTRDQATQTDPTTREQATQTDPTTREQAAATKIQRWLRQPTFKNRMDLVGWRPTSGPGDLHGHMTIRRHWGEKHPKSGEHPFEDIRQAGMKQYAQPENLGRGFNQLQIGTHPTDDDHRARMAGRPKPANAPGPRYDQTTSTRVFLSPLERFAVNRHLAQADAYHLWGEARQQRCTAARCMSPAELLLERRHQPPPAGLFEPHELVDHLAALNPETTGRVKKKDVPDPGKRHGFWKSALVGTEEKPEPLPKGWEDD